MPMAGQRRSLPLVPFREQTPLGYRSVCVRSRRLMRWALERLTRQAAWMAIIGRGICPTAQSHAWEKAALAQVTETLRFRRMVNASL